MRAADWDPAVLPSQSGRMILITGATSGLGYAAVRALSKAGAEVVLAARNEAKGQRTVEELRQTVPGANVRFMDLDTSSLTSVKAFCGDWAASGGEIDCLILNAGISNVPRREVSADGFERQLATNYLGHFAMTGLLLPYMRRSPDTRIVVQASLSHKRTQLHFDDLQLENSYSPMVAYSQSKLAMLTFAFELSRRLQATGSEIRAIPVHPGVAATEITRGGDRANPIVRRFAKTMFGLMGQSPDEGAWPMLYAATSPKAESGVYYGPSGPGERKGLPDEAAAAPYAKDEAIARMLWEISEELTGVRYLS